MTADEINDKLERGAFGKYEIKTLKAHPGFRSLQIPSDLNFQHGVADSVTEQYHRIDAAWNNSTKTLTLGLNGGGPGYFIPFIGNGAAQLAGVAQTASRGLGSYTPVIARGGGISWVVTGPFSGCYTADFFAPGGKVFAHLATVGVGYTADTVHNQVTNIAAQVNAHVPGHGHLKQVLGPGEGYVFWTKIQGSWYRRVIYTITGKVDSVEAKTQL